MRTLKIFAIGLVISLVSLLVVGLVAREVLLYLATTQLKAVAKNAQNLEIAGSFANTCVEYGGAPSDGLAITQTQVRFISDKKYVLEVLCRVVPSVREVLQDFTLPLLVRKEQGQSGLIRGRDGTAVTLSIFGRKGVVYQQDGFIFSSTTGVDETVYDFSQGPQATCQGYGFTCCDQVFQIGEGDFQSGTLDCSQSCFAQCLSRPVVLNFNSEPMSDANSRLVQLKSGETVNFFYTINDSGGDVFAEDLLFSENQLIDPFNPQAGKVQETTFEDKLLAVLDKYAARVDTGKIDNSVEKVILDFGDGSQEVLSELQGEVNHLYTCNKDQCQFITTLTAITSRGIENFATELSKIRVQVSP